jgi:hypothetical protein
MSRHPTIEVISRIALTLVTLQLRIATGGGHILTAQEAAHHQ